MFTPYYLGGYYCHLFWDNGDSSIFIKLALHSDYIHHIYDIFLFIFFRFPSFFLSISSNSNFWLLYTCQRSSSYLYQYWSELGTYSGNNINNKFSLFIFFGPYNDLVFPKTGLLHIPDSIPHKPTGFSGFEESFPLLLFIWV